LAQLAHSRLIVGSFITIAAVETLSSSITAQCLRETNRSL